MNLELIMQLIKHDLRRDLKKSKFVFSLRSYLGMKEFFKSTKVLIDRIITIRDNNIY